VKRFAGLLLGLSIASCGSLAAAAEPLTTYKDPKGRYTLAHSADWVVMTNWGGEAELFCRFDPCRNSAKTTCSLQVMPLEDELDVLSAEMMASIIAGSMASSEGVEADPLFRLGEPESTGALEAGSLRWSYVRQNMKLLGLVDLQVVVWIAAEKRNMMIVSCSTAEAVWPSLKPRIETLLGGFALSEVK
jgi:hypothetical protein